VLLWDTEVVKVQIKTDKEVLKSELEKNRILKVFSELKKNIFKPMRHKKTPYVLNVKPRDLKGKRER